MTDFANDPLWEEDTKEPEVIKTPPQEQPEIVAAAGNAATAHAMSETLAPEPMMPAPDPIMTKTHDTAAPEAAVPEPKPEPEPEPAQNTAPPETTTHEPQDVFDWRAPLYAVIKAMNGGPLDRTLSPFLEVASHVPPAQVPMATGLILSAFLRLPMGARHVVRETLISNLSDWPNLPVARLILIRLGGLPVATPPPPPPPVADS
jgi:hypothetical protein